MRYEDSSQSNGLSETQSQPIDARDDSDALTAGSRGPATGNTVTGEGTQTGSVGADLANSEAQITAITGAGGSDSSFTGGKLQVAGEFGRLSIDAEGNYNYIADVNTPENSRDRFTYTLADKQGNSDTANLTIEFGKTPSAIQTNAQQVVPGPDGVVILPPGVELSDIRVVGRNLVIDLPDGTQMVIIDGAVFVPQLVLGTVEIPADNLAALLIGQEPQPAAGSQLSSSGGNFAVPVGPLDPGVPLGDLLPPTELFYQPPEVRELFDVLDRDPDVVIVTPDQPAGAEDATASVNEAALAARGVEPQGSGEESAPGPNGDPRETTTGTIVIDSPDGPNVTTINGIAVTGVGQTFPGTFGTLVITSITSDGIGYSYTLTTDTAGDSNRDLFTVVVTDRDGDTDTATLTINIVDDVPTARPDTDSIAAGSFAPATGNVITDAAPGDVGDSDTNAADTLGADNATLTSVSGAGGSDSTFDGSGNLVVNGQHGVLTIKADGSYSYARNPGSQGGVTDTFNYTLTDGDGDTSTSTLTISIGDLAPTLTLPVQGGAGTQVSEVGLPTRNGEPAGSGEAADGNGADNDDTSETTAGTIAFTQGDGPATVSINGTAVTAVGQTFTVAGVGVLTITSIAPGAIGYSFTLTDNTSGDNTSVIFGVTVRDQDGDTASSDLVIRIADDTPVARDDTDSVTEDGPLSTDGNVISGASTTSGAAGADTPGADGAVVQAPGTYNGTYGTLVINADGSYVYTLYTAAQNAAAAASVQGLSAGETLSDSFGYALVDGDGDSDPATLTITINGNDDGVTINGLDGQAPEEVVREDDLADGSSPDAAALIQGGTFSFTAGDGLNDVTVGGVLVIDGGVFQGVKTIADAKGTLTITGFTPTLDANGVVVGGTLSYTYQLTDNTLAHTGAADGALTQSFTVVVNDTDGSTDTDSLDVQIIDDVPRGVNDSATQAAEDANVTIDVFANDVKGADGALASSVQLVPGSQVGGGTLINNGNGTFTLDPLPGQTGTVTFQYSFVDLDGDVATATAVITLLADSAPSVVSTVNLTVDEDGFGNANVDATPLQTDPAEVDSTESLVQTGTAVVNFGNDVPAGSLTNSIALLDTAGLDGQLQLLNGAPVTFALVGGQLVGSSGGIEVIRISITGATAGPAAGQVSYTYQVELLQPLEHVPGAGENNALLNGVTFEATDADGDRVQGSFDVTVVDDVPTAANDTAAAAESSRDVNVGLVLDFSSSIDNSELNTQISAVKTAMEELYSGTTGDVTVRLVVFAATAISYGPFTSYADLAALLDSLNPATGGTRPLGSGTDFTAAISELMDVYSADPTANNQVFFLSDGNPNQQLGPGGTSLTASVATAWNNFVDSNGINVTAIGVGNNIDADRLQDIDVDGSGAPILVDGFDDLVETLLGLVQPVPVSGNVLANDIFGADGGRILSIVVDGVTYTWDGSSSIAVSSGGTIAGSSLSIDTALGGHLDFDFATGDYEYAPPTEVAATTNETFTYSIVDGDGDVDTANLVITVANDNEPTTSPVSATVDDDGLANGNPGGTGDFTGPANEHIATGTLGFDYGADGPGSVSFAGMQGLTATVGTETVVYGWNAANNTLTATVTSGPRSGTALFTVQITDTATGAYTVTLLDNVLHSAGGNENDAGPVVLTYRVGDATGTTERGTLSLTFDDDTPTGVNDSAAQTSEDANVTINVFANDIKGADGALASSVQLVPGSQVGGGVLTNNGNGTFTLDPAPGQSGIVTFQYTFLDADGDVGTATATITLRGDSAPTVASTTNVTVDEDGFGNANVDSTPLQSSPAEVNSNESLVQTGTAVVSFGNDRPTGALTNSVTLVDTAALDGQLQLLNGAPVTFALVGGVLVGSAGGTEVIRISITGAATGPGAGQVSYTYQVQLLQPVEHAPGGGENSDLLSGVTFEATDADGDKVQGTFDVTVVDDVPTANAEPTRTIAEDAVGTIGGNVITDSESNGGADQLGADGGLLTSVTIDGTTTAIAAAGTTTVTTAKGVYTFTSAGAWTFDPAPGQNAASPINAGFSYTITDGDGDQATATQPIQITDGAGPLGGDSVTLALDDQNLPNGRTSGGPDFDSDTVDFTTGSDAIATIVFGTDLSTLDGTNLTWTRTSGTEIRGTDTATGALVVTLTLARSGDDVTVTATLNNNYDAHPTINVDDLVNLGSVKVIATDTDGDTAEGTVAITVSDDIPTIGATSNVTMASTTSTAGNFPFAINADDYPLGTAASSFLSASLAGKVGSTAITVTQQPTYVSTTGGVATYSFAFTYDSDPTSTSDAPVANTGTINFNIGAGTYTVSLANPIQSFSTSQTSKTIAKFSYNTEGSASQSEVVVSQLETNLFVQFTGDADTNSGPLVAGSTAPGTFTNGETFTAAQTWVSISNEENGVAGDTIQGGEVLDFNLYSNNPGSNTSLAPTASATGMTLRLDGVGSEDFVVILKLYDTATMTYTTKAVIIGSNDIYRNGETLPVGYSVTPALDNNDGFVIIEANDFQQGNTNLVIVGAQLISSTEGIAGSGIDLNRATGTGGGSTTVKAFGDVENATTSATNDQDVVKIVDIGLTRSVTNTQSLSMDFTVTVKDFDNDTATAHLLVNPPPPPAMARMSIADTGDSLLVSDSGSNQKFAGNEKIVANSNTLAMTAAVVGFDTQAAAQTVTMDQMTVGSSVDASASPISATAATRSTTDVGKAGGDALSIEAKGGVDQANGKGSSNNGQGESAKSDHGLAGEPANDGGPAKDSAPVDHGPAKPDPVSSPSAPDVALPSAEALAAAGLADGNQRGGSVEKVIAEAISAANGAPTVDALLDALPGHGNGGLAALQSLASQDGASVPAWDMGGHGGFNPAADLLFKVEAVMLHQDAVQPVANG